MSPSAKKSNRGYQYDFSQNSPHVFDRESREKKARTTIAVLEDALRTPLNSLCVINIGGSAGIIDNFLADYFMQVVGIDIDHAAIQHAKRSFAKKNLAFQVADALALPFRSGSVDVAICSHVYEHVLDPRKMLNEIRRVLKPDGICYFSAGNRLMWNEPHYNLPLLSVMPRSLAHLYIRFSGKAKFYHEKHLSYWSLKNLVRDFDVNDYTVRIIEQPAYYHTRYMLPPGSLKHKIAAMVAKYAYWAMPGYVWILRKNESHT